MSLINFEYVPVTTMTVVISFTGRVNILQAFPLLEITRMKIEESNRRRQKFKIPHPGFPGAILSATYGGFTRGIVRSTTPKFFRNSITIDISTKKKNVNIKLSATGIQMCGPTSDDMAMEAANYLIDNLYKAQDMIDYIRFNPEIAEITLDWVKEHTKGESVLVAESTDKIIDQSKIVFYQADGVINSKDRENREKSDDSDVSNDNNVAPIVGYVEPEVVFNESENVWEQIQGYYVQRVNSNVIPDEYTTGFPETIDKNIAKFLVEQAPDYSRHDIYSIHLDWLMTLSEIIQRPVQVCKLQKAMVNYNYDLGFDVDRWELCRRIHGVNGFSARYENTTDHCVTIQLPYKIPQHLGDLIAKKNKLPKHSFLVYKSGLVTQSGPCEELSKDAYMLFNRTILNIRHYIVKKSPCRKMKYLSFEEASKIRETLNDHGEYDFNRLSSSSSPSSPSSSPSPSYSALKSPDPTFEPHIHLSNVGILQPIHDMNRSVSNEN